MNPNILSNLSPNTKILSIDAETPHLHGEAFAIGAVVLNMQGAIQDTFAARCPRVPGQTQKFTEEVIVPLVEGDDGINHVYASARGMRDIFWSWLMKWTRDANKKYRSDVLVVVDFGIPCESNLFSACVADDHEAREWLLPYPSHELGTLLLAVGDDPDVNREEYVAPLLRGAIPRKHDPRWDSLVSAHIARWCLSQLSNRLKMTQNSAPVSMGCLVEPARCSICGVSTKPCSHIQHIEPPAVNFLYMSIDSTPNK